MIAFVKKALVVDYEINNKTIECNNTRMSNIHYAILVSCKQKRHNNCKELYKKEKKKYDKK